MKKIISTLSLITVISIMSACSNTTSSLTLPESIKVNATKLYPEGISYADKIFYLGSLYQGKIVSVDMKGDIKAFVEDDALVSVVGIKVDKMNNRLIACNSDGGFGQKSSDATKGHLAKVMIYDLTSGKRLQSIDLSKLYQGGHFVNDLTLDDAGNIYVTDSFSPVIYKIDNTAKASILVENKEFKAPQGSFGLNGIVYHDGYLITGRADIGQLYKVPLDNPQNITAITLDKEVHSLDGLLLAKDGSLILVSNNFAGAPFDEAVYKIQSTDNWKSASVVAKQKIEGNVFPTTLTEVGESIYVNYSHIPALITNTTPIDQFKIQKIHF